MRKIIEYIMEKMNLLVEKKHINWIESFWSFTKRRFIKFNGIKKEFFLLYLKESEFRYNVRIEKWNLYKILLKKLRNFNP